MDTLYYFEALLNDKRTLNLVSSGDRDSVFFTAMILEKSEFVLQFKVSSGAMTNSNAELWHFGEFKKWVQKFNYNLEP